MLSTITGRDLREAPSVTYNSIRFVVYILWILFLGTNWRLSLQEGVKTENDHINLKVAGQDGSVVQFKIKRHTPLSKLMKAYCERQVSLEAGLTLPNGLKDH